MKTGLVLSRAVRTMAGLGTGAAVSTLCVAALGRVLHLGPFGDVGNPEHHLVPLVLGISASLASLATIVGLPAHAVLYWLRLRNGFWYIGLAALAGLAFAGFVVSEGDSVDSLVIYSGWVSLCGGIAWLVRRPDRDDKPVKPPPETHF